MIYTFLYRHVGSIKNIQHMLRTVSAPTLPTFIDQVIPNDIKRTSPINLNNHSERDTRKHLLKLANKNKVYKSYIGMGFYGSIIPQPIVRHVIRNPMWYTPYTPYQAECNQGKLENLINYQTMISDLTGMDICNSSLLDLSSAYFEAILMARRLKKKIKNPKVFIQNGIHPIALDVLRTRLEPLNIEIIYNDFNEYPINSIKDDLIAFVIEYPDVDGNKQSYIDQLDDYVHNKLNTLLVVGTEPLSLAIMKPPGEWGADIVIGTTQRFGLPLSLGGPHSAFIACKEQYIRQLPGKLVGIAPTIDGESTGYRMCLQTREQHIKKDRATSNICTSQVLLAHLSAFYGVYHGADGLRGIAHKINKNTRLLGDKLVDTGYDLLHKDYFDTLLIKMDEYDRDCFINKALEHNINFRRHNDGIGITMDETVDNNDILKLMDIFDTKDKTISKMKDVDERTSNFMTADNFNQYHSETEFMRYTQQLGNKDISLGISMMPLGSCTMKLNNATSMEPMTYREFNGIHPYTPLNQIQGYVELFDGLRKQLLDVCCMDDLTFQPLAGSHGEYTGLMIIKKYFESLNENHRNMILIPESAHGTNFASAIQAGFNICKIKNLDNGELDMNHLNDTIIKHKDNLAGIMITYPSTFGSFDSNINQIIDLIHNNNGQVYMDGANMNAMVGICELNVDVMHLNLHKTFAIPHGGGGPGACPVLVKKHLSSFLPTDPTKRMNTMGDTSNLGPLNMTHWGNAGVLPITYSYLYLLGHDVAQCSIIAILNANYMMHKLNKDYNVRYYNENKRVSHEFIIDLKSIRDEYGITANDIAKRLIDYGFHAPTMNWPINNCFMIEPTESESVKEMDRFCDAMINIKNEIVNDSDIVKNSPYTADMLIKNGSNKGYVSYPYKYWTPIGRLDDVAGDRKCLTKW